MAASAKDRYSYGFFSANAPQRQSYGVFDGLEDVVYYAPLYVNADPNLSIPFYLVEFHFDSGNEFITTLDRPIYYGGNKYEVFPVVVGDITYDPQNLPESVQITLSNVNKEYITILLNEHIQGKQSRVLRSYFSHVNTYTTPMVMFDGYVDSLMTKDEYDTTYVQFELRNEFYLWDRAVPRHQYSGNCNWMFKSTTPGCQYTGTASLCNRTYQRCTELGNTVNFKGFRQLIALETAELWWGKYGPK